MEKQFVYIKLWLLIFSISILCSCHNDEMTSSSLEDLTDEDLISLVKLNFLESYGGIELERLEICKLPLTHSEICDLDTTVNLDLGGVTSDFNLTLKGDYSINCYNSSSTYNNKFIYYHDKGSFGVSAIGGIEQEYDLQSSFTIAGNTEDQVYVTHGDTRRSLTFISAEHKNLHGSISFYSNSCQFDFPSCNLGPQTQYKVNLELVDRLESSNRLQLEGTIKKENSIWTLRTEKGIVSALE